MAIANWISLSSNSGSSGTTVVTITAATYQELTARTASLVVRTVNSNLSETVSVTQEPREVATVSVSPTTITATETGGTYTFNVISNGDWTITAPNWLTLSASAGTGNATITVTIPANTSLTANTGNIVVSTLDNTATVQVYESATTSTVSVSPTEITGITSGGSAYTITITSNDSWTITAPAWVTLSSTAGTGNGSIIVTVAPNDSGAKSGTITITTANNATATVSLSQTGAASVISVDPTTISNVASGGSAYTITVSANTDWVVTGCPTWVTLSATAGTGNGSIIATVVINPDLSRTDSIDFMTTDSAATASTSIQQDGNPDVPTATTSDYFTIQVISGGTLYWYYPNYGNASNKTISYNVNDNGWNSVTSSYNGSGTTIATVNTGDIIKFRGNNNLYRDNRFVTDCIFNVYGNIMSLIKSTGFETATTLNSGYTFQHLFNNCTGLRDASNLILPATTLKFMCYYYMFRDCTGLTKAPSALPATTLADGCYGGMFSGCTNLQTIPSNYLPATTLADGCYALMFYNCTSLTTAPTLPATTLVYGCYQDMFYGCTSLTTAPALPATTLAEQCYQGMFQECSNLLTAPALPATTLASSCYRQMFSGCTSLTTAPALPATNFGDSLYTYNAMFYGCTSLTTAPAELPATTLTDGCYYAMFQGCTSLTKAPDLPATTLVTRCYEFMFSGCTHLNQIKCLATSITANYCTADWVNGVASSGTFVKNSSMTSWTTGTSGIPNNWEVTNASS